MNPWTNIYDGMKGVRRAYFGVGLYLEFDSMSNIFNTPQTRMSTLEA